MYLFAVAVHILLLLWHVTATQQLRRHDLFWESHERNAKERFMDVAKDLVNKMLMTDADERYVGDSDKSMNRYLYTELRPNG